MAEEKYAVLISVSHDCQLLDKWQYCLIEKYGIQDSEWVCGNQRPKVSRVECKLWKK